MALPLGLLRNRSFALLWFAGLISMTGDWAIRVALPIFVYRLTGSAVWTSAVIAVFVGVILVVGTFAGVYVDRWDRRRVLVIANLCQAAAMLPLLAVTNAGTVPLVLVVVAATSALAQFVEPAEHALLPRLVPEDDLASANSLNALNNNLARLVGPAVGGGIAALTGLTGAALFNAATFLLAAGLVALIRGTYRAAVDTPAVGSALGRLRADFADGVRALWRSTVLRAVLVVVAAMSIGEGVMGSLFAVFVDDALDGGPAQLGWLMSGQAVGGIAGGLVGAAVARRVPPTRLLVGSLVAFGAIDLVIFNYPRWSTAIGPAIALFVIVGIPGAWILAGILTLLQTEVADAFRGRVFSAATLVQAAAMLIGTGIAAALTERLGVIVLLTVQGSGYIVAGVCFALLVPRRVPAPPAATTPSAESVAAPESAAAP